MRSWLMNVVKVLLPLLVLVAASAVTFVTVANRPEPERRPPHIAVTEVEFALAQRSSYVPVLASRGTVRPRTESTLIPEVAGRVVEMSAKLRAGEFFEPDDVLLRIDPRDYQVGVTVAKAELAQVRSVLVEEQARAEQARRDWENLGELGEPDALVLRKPQVAGARAAVSSAQARLVQAELNLERTTIRAPYAGRVLEQNVDIGQYVSPGIALARVYAVDYVEVRLPLTNRQLEFIEVPEIYRTDTDEARTPGPLVRLTARIGSRVHTWTGRIVRAEGAIDTESRQLFVVVQVDDPYDRGPADRPPLKIGQFVEASIDGSVLEKVFVVPPGVLRAGSEVLVVSNDERLESRAVEVGWRDANNVAITDGLRDGDRVVVTPLGAGMHGVEVRAAPAPPARIVGETAADTS